MLVSGRQEKLAEAAELQQLKIADVFGHMSLSSSKKRSRTASAFSVGNIVTMVLTRENYFDLCKNKIVDSKFRQQIDKMCQHYVGEQDTRTGAKNHVEEEEDD